jgi:hypothetical protein
MGAARIMVVVFASVMMIAAAFVRNGRHGKVRRLVEGGGRDGDHALTPIVTRPGPTSTRWATEAARGCDRKPKIKALLVSCLERHSESVQSEVCNTDSVSMRDGHAGVLVSWGDGAILLESINKSQMAQDDFMLNAVERDAFVQIHRSTPREVKSSFRMLVRDG